jgi:hypothetical protein
MSYLTQINIADVPVVRSVPDMPVGAILQIAAAGLPEAASQDPASLVYGHKSKPTAAVSSVWSF